MMPLVVLTVNSQVAKGVILIKHGFSKGHERHE